MQLRIEHFHTAEAFTALSQEWLALLEESGINEVFVTPEFQASWWRTLGEGELHLTTYRNQKNQLVGIAPLLLQQGEVRFLGCTDVSDYVDFIIHTEYQAAVYDEIAATIKTLSPTRITLCSIPQSSTTLLELPKHLAPAVSLKAVQQDVCPQVTLPSTWDEYLAQLSRKQRHELRRKWNKIESMPGFQVKTYTDVDSVRQHMPAFISLHQQSSESKRNFWDQPHQSFFIETIPQLAERQWVRLSFLHIAEQPEPIASMLLFTYQQKYQLYNSGFDPNFATLSPGLVLTSMTIKDAIDNGAAIYDFLRGDERYKFQFGATAQPIFDLTAAPPGFQATELSSGQ